MKFDTQGLSPAEEQEINRLLTFSHNDPPELEDIWKIMDRVWDELECDNSHPNSEKIAQYYQHPVWILNGIFIENHELSLQHREAIASWVIKMNFNKILDFGGGIGILDSIIAEKNSQIIIDIYEPYPTQYAQLKTQKYKNINFVNSLTTDYDCLISTDVLEHVNDPLDLLAKMIESVKLNGYLIIANHFYPSIKCHLPSTFHFRFTFDQFAHKMGLINKGTCEANHIIIYKKVAQINFDWQQLRKMEANSKFWFPLRNGMSFAIVYTKKIIKKLLLRS